MQLPHGITEETLIRQCKNGDMKHMELLYKHFYGYAMGVGLRYTNNREDALEIVNDSFMKIFSAINTYHADKPFKAWLRRIVINTAIDKKRKEQKHMWNAGLEQAENTEQQLTVIETMSARDILNFLEKLPETQKLIFNLYEIDGYSHDEIAVMLNITPSSSRVYLSRGKEKLRNMITKAENNYERRA